MTDMNRSKSREIAMTALYQIFIYESNKIVYDTKTVIKELIEIQNDFVIELVEGVINKKQDIDNIINKNLKNWTIDRLGKTDQAILRIGVYELMYTDTPDIVCINESVELAKKYSDDKVKNMINGVLDNLLNNKDNQ